MDIEEFRKQFIDEIRFEAAHDGTDPESLFIEKTLSELEDIGELNDPIPFSVEMRGSRNRLLAFDAYAYDETDGALVLIASDFTNQRDVAPALTNTKIEDLFSHMLNFIDDAVNGSLPKFCEDSDPALLMGEEFKRKIGSDMVSTEIMRFKFIIISIIIYFVIQLIRGKDICCCMYNPAWKNGCICFLFIDISNTISYHSRK